MREQYPLQLPHRSMKDRSGAGSIPEGSLFFVGLAFQMHEGSKSHREHRFDLTF